MNKKQLIFGALLGLPTLANADAKFTTTPLTIAAGETDKEVAIYLANDEDGGKSFQITVTLPDGLYFGDSDYMTIANEARLKGWTLVKSQQADGRDDIDPITGVNRTHTWMFVGFKAGGTMPQNVDDAAAEKGTPILKFRVNAQSDFDAAAAGKIELSGAKLAGITGTSYDEDTAVEGVLKFDPATNWINVDGGAQGVETTFDLTPAHTQTISFELHNDAPIRGLQGYIRLPKGLSLSPVAGLFGTVGNFDTTVRTEGDYLTIGTPIQEADGSWTIKFAAATMLPQFRKASEFGTPLFTFDVVGNDPEDATAPFDATQVEIVIDDFRANAGGGKSYVMDDVVKIKVTNANQVAKDEEDANIGQNTDAADPDGSIWATYNAQVEAVDATIANSSDVLAQEEAARNAIQALEHEVYQQWKAGTLQDWTDPDGLEDKAKEEIAKIATVAAATLTKAGEYEAEAQKWIDNAEELDVPDFLNQYKDITPIKDERDENKGTLADAKAALAAALQDSKDNGLLGDNKTSADESLADLEQAVQDLNGELKTAIEAAEAAKVVEDGKAQAALDAPVALLEEQLDDNEKAYIRQDDSDGTYAAAWAIYEEKIDALEAAFGTNGEDGTVGAAGQAADLDVYKTEIEAVEAAIEGVSNAVKAVKDKAAANNAAAEKAKIDFALPANVDEDDTPGTFATAIGILDQAVADAAEAGTQAWTDIYKDAIAGVKAAQEAVIAKGAANKAKADEALAEYGKYDYQNDQYDGVAIAELEALGIKYADIKKNAEVKQAVDNYEAAVLALQHQVEDVELVGNEAKDNIYKDQLDNFYKYEQELQDKILEIAEVAKQNEIAAATALGTTVDKPEGTGKNDAYDDIKGSQDVIDAEQALTDAKNALTAAIDEAKDAGTLGDTNPSPLDDEIEAVEKAVEDLAAEYEKQSEQAAENYDTAEAAAAAEADFSEVKAENLDDVNESKIVEDAKAEFEAAQQAVADQYQAMLDADKAGDATETETLNELKQTLDEKLEAYNEAIETASEAIEEINEMTADVTELQKSLADTNSDSELVRAKVANPAEVTQEYGKLPTTQEQYLNLVAGLNKLATDIQDQIDAMKAEFKAGTKTQEQVQTWMENDLPALVQAAQKQAVEDLVAYVSTVENGDVGGDGRWTSNDYARLRKVILDETYPEHAAFVMEEDEFGEEYYDGIDLEKLFDAEGKLLNTEEIYRYYRMDLNKDGYINVGDAQGALNYAFYGTILGPVAARANNGAEALTAQMNGNVIAVALQNARQYSAFQMDVVLPEGMTIANQSLASRNEGFSIATSELANGATRILVSATEAGKAFEGNEGDVLYIEVSGNGTVEFQNVIFADLNAGVTKFQLAAVGAETTGINGVNTQVAEGEQVYSLSGRMMNALKKGINIIRRADGTSQKVIKK